jgi:membrane associated rhomboid family serine protease
MDSPELRLRRAWEARRVPWMTALIVGLCIRMHLWFWGSSAGEWVWEKGTRWWPAVAEKGESWRLLSYGFLHANFAHITMNLLFVAYAGVALENMFGSAGLLLLFVAGVWGGGLFSSMLDPTTKAVGASAGDFALLGASILFGWRHADIIPARAKPAFGAVILLFTLQALFGSMGEQGVDWQAHLGGAIFGGVFGSLLVPTALAHAQRRNRWVHGIFWTMVLASLLGLWAAAPSGLRWTPVVDGEIHTVRPLWWEPGWTVFGASGWVSPTGEASLVVETTEEEKYWSNTEEEEELRLQLQELDPQVSFTHLGDGSGLEPTLTELTFEARYVVEGRSWYLRGWMATRGSYRYRLLVEGLDPTLVGMVYDSAGADLQVPLPEKLLQARKNWRPGLRRASLELAAEERRIGNGEGALAPLRSLLTEARNDPQLAREILDELTLLHEGGEEEAEQLLSAFPDNRKIQLRGVTFFREHRKMERAEQLLVAAEQRWPEDRAVQEARATLSRAAEEQRQAPEQLRSPPPPED